MRKLTLLVTALLFAASAASGVSIKSNRCGIDVYARPDFGTWFYTVTVTVKRSCPPGSFAQVRLESYVGGGFPRGGWFTVTASTPLERGGIPRYWRVSERAENGEKTYHRLPIPPLDK